MRGEKLWGGAKAAFFVVWRPTAPDSKLIATIIADRERKWKNSN
jgi:hypothetical protein